MRYEQNVFAPNLLSLTDIFSLKSYREAKILNTGIDETTAIVKRTFDVLFSLSVMAIGFPVFLGVACITKLTSKGSIFYKQERIGENGQPFFIYKFRSMKIDAEKYGPQLAKGNDPRITPWGNIMRKTHLDELPQFFNVIKGDMSIVGPRPERAHFIEQIVKKAPAYRELQRIKPGITSIGQVSFGYAESVDEMCERMMLDLKYLGEVNLWTDINIIAQTVMTMVLRKGQ